MTNKEFYDYFDTYTFDEYAYIIDKFHKEIYTPDKKMKQFNKGDILNDGVYITIRISMFGIIYQQINEWVGTDWKVNVADGSKVIAYRELTKEDLTNI